MGKKRKQDPGREDSSSSDTKRCRSCHCHNGETSRPSDGMPPWEGLADIGRAVIELKDVVQLHFRTEEKYKRKFRKLKERVKEKRKKDKKKHKEDLRVLKEELESKIQEMQKEACAEVNHYKASPSQRSQLSQSTRFRLVIETSMSEISYKTETVQTEDGGGRIKVVMYDGGDPIASDHHLASVKVELVLIEGRFDEKRDSWSKEEFEKSIIKPRETTKSISMLTNGTFDLRNGWRDYEGAIIMDNSQKKEVKLGVRIAGHTKIRVLEGVSNPFKVQERKTKTAPNKKGNKPSPPVITRNVVQPINTHATQHGQGHVFFSKRVSLDEQHGLPPPVFQDVLQKADCGMHTELTDGDGTSEDNLPATVLLMVEGNGQALNGNGQQSCQQIPSQFGQQTSTHSMQNDQGCSLPPPSMPNAFQVAGNYPAQCNGFAIASSPLAFLNDHLVNNITQWTSPPSELGFPQSTGGISAEHIPNLDAQTLFQDLSFISNQVLLQWDEPHVDLKKHWNFLDLLMPLYSTQSGFYRESFPGTSTMDKTHKLLASASSVDSVLKITTSVTCRATQTPQRRGILIRPIEPYESDDWPPGKKQMNAKYQLRFVNTVCNDYYTREQIKSEDGNLLKVALYDENNLVVTSGPLSSASVEVVLLHGDFSAEGHDYWTSEEFSACLVHPQSVKEPAAFGGDRVFTLIDGEADLGNINFQTSSFHARTGKFIMGVEIKDVSGESVQEGITTPFLVRVRQGKESSRQRIRSLEALLRVKSEVPKQVCGPLECDAKEKIRASSVLHDQSLHVRSVFGTSRTEDPDSMVQTASDRPPEPSWQGVKWSAPPTPLKAQKHVVMEENNSNTVFTDSSKRMKLELFSAEKSKSKDVDDSATTVAEPSSAIMGRAAPLLDTDLAPADFEVNVLREELRRAQERLRQMIEDYNLVPKKSSAMRGRDCLHPVKPSKEQDYKKHMAK